MISNESMRLIQKFFQLIRKRCRNSDNAVTVGCLRGIDDNGSACFFYQRFTDGNTVVFEINISRCECFQFTDADSGPVKDLACVEGFTFWYELCSEFSIIFRGPYIVSGGYTNSKTATLFM